LENILVIDKFEDLHLTYQRHSLLWTGRAYGRSQSSLQTLGVRLLVGLLEHLIDVGSEKFWGSGRGVASGIGVAECSTGLSVSYRRFLRL